MVKIKSGCCKGPKFSANIRFMLRLTEKILFKIIAKAGQKFFKVQTKLLHALILIKNGLAKEGDHTAAMIEIYYRYTQGLASPQEMKLANKQFQELLKALGLGAFVILPFAPLTIPLIVRLGKYFGIDVIPKSFQEEKK